MVGTGIDQGADRFGGPLDALGCVAEHIDRARAQVRRADALGQHEHTRAVLGEPYRGGQPGQAGADHDDVVMARTPFLSHVAVGQVLDVEQALEDPVVEARLAQLVAVEDRPDALPALLQEAAQRCGGLGAVEAPDAVQDPGGPVDAEAALAGAHAQAHAAPDVVQVGRPAPAHGLLQTAAADQLALADQLLVSQRRLPPAQPRAEPVGLPVLVAGGTLLVRAAWTHGPELRAHRVDDVLGHQAQRRELAAGHREQAVDAVALAVVDDGVRAADVARVGHLAGLLVLEERAHAGPDAQRARIRETPARAARRRRASASTSSCVTGISSGSAARLSVVPITLTVRIGTRMSPSAGIVQRLITVFTSRWFMAIMIPLPGTTPTPSIPAM